MLDIGQILQKADEQKTFEVHIVEDNPEDNWTLNIKKPPPRKSQRWINFMMSNFMAIMDRQKAENALAEEVQTEQAGKRFLMDNLDTLLDFAGEILDLTESWEGIQAENKKQIKDFMLLTPIQAASFAVQFISDLQNWQTSLKKNYLPELNGNSI